MRGRLLCAVAALFALSLFARTAGAAPPDDDWRVRGALAALETGDPSLYAPAVRVLADRKATSAFDAIVEHGRARLDDREIREALARALGALQTRPAESLPLLVEILAREADDRSSKTCNAFAAWRESKDPAVNVQADRLAPPADAGIEDWISCVGAWTPTEVDALIALYLDPSNLGLRFPSDALAKYVARGQRAGAASRIFSKLAEPALETEARERLILGLGSLGHGSREILQYLDRAAEDPALAEAAIVAIAQLLPKTPDAVIPPDRLVKLVDRLGANPVRRHHWEGVLAAHSPVLRARFLATYESMLRAAPSDDDLQFRCLNHAGESLQSLPGDLPPTLVEAIESALRSTNARARACGFALGLASAERAPQLVGPLIEAARLVQSVDDRADRLASLISLGAAARIADDIVASYGDRDWLINDPIAMSLASATIDEATAARLRPVLWALLLDREYKRNVERFGPALFAVGPIAPTEGITLIERTYDADLDVKAIVQLRFWAIALSGGDPAAVVAARWLAAGKSMVDALEPAVARTALDATLGVIVADSGRNVAAQARALLRKIIDDTRWARTDAEYLRELRLRLPSDAKLADARVAVDRRLAELAPPSPSWARQIGSWAWRVVGGHFLIWLGLLVTLYPRSRFWQSAVLFNPLGRKITGWGYTQLLILASPWLRRRLFAPLVEPSRDAEVAGFDERTFYDQVRIEPILPRPSPQAPDAYGAAVSWTTLVDERGLVVIEGASGLGKTYLQKALLARARAAGRTCLFVRALDCNEGVVKQIEDRLARGGDRFVDALIHRGAIDLLIDGLNEALPSGVAEIARFCERATNARIVVSTQPMTWACPRRARRFRLLPLERGELEGFLNKQWTAVRAPADAENVYQARIQAFVAARAGVPRDLAVLQNPIDLAFVAFLLARGQTPDIHGLRRQVVDDAARAYVAAAPGGAFPISALAAAAIRVLETGHPVIDVAGIDPVVLDQLAERKLLLRRSGGDWLFRHDTITCYFAAAGFFAGLITGDAIDPRAITPAHLSNQRFGGVYLQLAESLPFRAADRLALAIRDRGRTTGDRTLEVAFQDVLDRRPRP